MVRLLSFVFLIGSFILRNFAGSADSPTILFDVSCTGEEATIFECAHSEEGTCGTNEDVAVVCQSK